MQAYPFYTCPPQTTKRGEPQGLSSFCWCGRRELNPYGKTTRPSNVRVCQFRHSRNGFYIIHEEIAFVKRFLAFFKKIFLSVFLAWTFIFFYCIILLF